MDSLVDVISKAPETRAKNDDDFADRLSSRYTVVLLIVFAGLVGIIEMMYLDSPITCWAPVHFTGAHTKFMTSYCWVKNTYYLPWDDDVPVWDADQRQMVPYYQWIPFILLAQAVLFYMPTLVWHALNSKAGVDADSILAAAHTFTGVLQDAGSADKMLAILVKQMDRFLVSRRPPLQQRCAGCSQCARHGCQLCGRRLGNYLVVLFLVSKLFYIANVVAQLFLLDFVLATKYQTFGYDVTAEFARRRDWTEQSYVAFPRVTLCDFKVRGQDMANVHPYTVQCVLPINLYNESIYVFLWYWMLCVAAVSILSFLIWLIRCSLPVDRVRFVRGHIHRRTVDSDHRTKTSVDAKQLREFVESYLRADGVFLLRLIAHNTNGVAAADITLALWKDWAERQALRRKAATDTMSSSVLLVPATQPSSTD